jgi:hypothetical protein
MEKEIEMEMDRKVIAAKTMMILLQQAVEASEELGEQSITAILCALLSILHSSSENIHLLNNFVDIVHKEILMKMTFGGVPAEMVARQRNHYLVFAPGDDKQH